MLSVQARPAGSSTGKGESMSVRVPATMISNGSPTGSPLVSSPTAPAAGSAELNGHYATPTITRARHDGMQQPQLPMARVLSVSPVCRGDRSRGEVDLIEDDLDLEQAPPPNMPPPPPSRKQHQQQQQQQPPPPQSSPHQLVAGSAEPPPPPPPPPPPQPQPTPDPADPADVMAAAVKAPVGWFFGGLAGVFEAVEAAGDALGKGLQEANVQAEGLAGALSKGIQSTTQGLVDVVDATRDATLGVVDKTVEASSHLGEQLTKGGQELSEQITKGGQGIASALQLPAREQGDDPAGQPPTANALHANALHAIAPASSRFSTLSTGTTGSSLSGYEPPTVPPRRRMMSASSSLSGYEPPTVPPRHRRGRGKKAGADSSAGGPPQSDASALERASIESDALLSGYEGSEGDSPRYFTGQAPPSSAGFLSPTASSRFTSSTAAFERDEEARRDNKGGGGLAGGLAGGLGDLACVIPCIGNDHTPSVYSPTPHRTTGLASSHASGYIAYSPSHAIPHSPSVRDRKSLDAMLSAAKQTEGVVVGGGGSSVGADGGCGSSVAAASAAAAVPSVSKQLVHVFDGVEAAPKDAAAAAAIAAAAAATEAALASPPPSLRTTAFLGRTRPPTPPPRQQRQRQRIESTQVPAVLASSALSAPVLSAPLSPSQATAPTAATTSAAAASAEEVSALVQASAQSDRSPLTSLFVFAETPTVAERQREEEGRRKSAARATALNREREVQIRTEMEAEVQREAERAARTKEREAKEEEATKEEAAAKAAAAKEEADRAVQAATDAAEREVAEREAEAKEEAERVAKEEAERAALLAKAAKDAAETRAEAAKAAKEAEEAAKQAMALAAEADREASAQDAAAAERLDSRGYGPAFDVWLPVPAESYRSFGFDLEYLSQAHGMPEVLSMLPGGLAATVGTLQIQDVVTHVNGVGTAAGSRALYNAMAAARGGQYLTLTCRRAQQLPAASPSPAGAPAGAPAGGGGSRAPPDSAAGFPEHLGTTAPLDVSAERSAELRLTQHGYGAPLEIVLAVPKDEWTLGLHVEYCDDTHGMPEVIDLQPGSLAGGSGHIRVGDVLTHVNGVDTSAGLGAIRYAVRASRGQPRLRLIVRRVDAVEAAIAAERRLSELGFERSRDVVLSVPSQDVTLGFDVEYADGSHHMPEILALVPDGLAERCGQLLIGDVVTHVNGIDTSAGPQALCDAIDAARECKRLVLTTRRRGRDYGGAGGTVGKKGLLAPPAAPAPSSLAPAPSSLADAPSSLASEQPPSKPVMASMRWLESEVNKTSEQETFEDDQAGCFDHLLETKIPSPARHKVTSFQEDTEAGRAPSATVLIGAGEPMQRKLSFGGKSSSFGRKRRSNYTHTLQHNGSGGSSGGSTGPSPTVRSNLARIRNSPSFLRRANKARTEQVHRRGGGGSSSPERPAAPATVHEREGDAPTSAVPTSAAPSAAPSSLVPSGSVYVGSTCVSSASLLPPGALAPGAADVRPPSAAGSSASNTTLLSPVSASSWGSLLGGGSHGGSQPGSQPGSQGSSWRRLGGLGRALGLAPRPRPASDSPKRIETPPTRGGPRFFGRAKRSSSQGSSPYAAAPPAVASADLVV